MEDIRIGQRVLINGTNRKRKAAENIPLHARAAVISISHNPKRETIYNVQVDGSGHKHGLYRKEFVVLDVSKAGGDDE